MQADDLAQPIADQGEAECRKQQREFLKRPINRPSPRGRAAARPCRLPGSFSYAETRWNNRDWRVTVCMKAETLERRRRKVLDVAATLFASEDYARVHMEDVALAADIAKPTLYRYFPTKEALFMAALEQMLGELQSKVATLRTEAGSAEARLRRTIALIHHEIGALAPALRAIEGEGSGPSEDSRRMLRRGMRDLRDEVVSLIEEGNRRGEFDTTDAQLAALAILGAIRMAAIVGSGTGGSSKRLSDLLLGGLARRTDPGASLARPAQALAIGGAS
jgi:AcrR family transcriptional regulator